MGVTKIITLNKIKNNRKNKKREGDFRPEESGCPKLEICLIFTGDNRNKG